MATTATSAQFQADISRYLDSKVLRLAQRHLVVRQFAQKIKIPTGEGLTYTATRFNRLVLPFAPLNEGVPPVGQAPTIQQVTGICVQWGDRVTVTDVADLTIKHPVFQQAIRLLGIQVPETYERNILVQLCSGQQVNYVNSRGARASLVAGDVLDPTTVNRTVVNLKNLGAPMWNGPQETDIRRSIEEGPAKSKKDPMASEHYVAVGSPLVIEGDFATNSTVQLAWAYSDINKLYISEVGQWRGMHFCSSNMVPSWYGGVQATGTAGTSGSLAGAPTNYYIVWTGSDTQNQYESYIGAISAAISVTGPNGSISTTSPNVAGYTWSCYVGTSSTLPTNLGLSTSGPTVGPYAGQAVQIPSNTAIVVTALGMSQVPPAAPGSTITVFPTFVFGQDAFAALEIEKLTWTRLTNADKSDPLNQLKVVGWKGWDGMVWLNQQFAARIESATANTGAFG
jgi:N4-gp56 family major capsid protein